MLGVGETQEEVFKAMDDFSPDHGSMIIFNARSIFTTHQNAFGSGRVYPPGYLAMYKKKE